MSCTVLLQCANGSQASWKASWKILPATTSEQSFQSADVTFQPGSTNLECNIHKDHVRLYISHHAVEGRNELETIEISHTQALAVLVDALGASSGEVAMKLVAPAYAGSIVLDDIVRRRLQDLECVESVTTLARPLQQYDGRQWSATTGLITLITGSAAAIRLRITAPAFPQVIEKTFSLLEHELYSRLPGRLTVPDLRRRTLAFLEGSEILPNTGGCSHQFYCAAASLGVDIVVLGTPGHWLQSPDFSHWRKEFIPIEFGHDVGFPSRIVEAIKQSSEPVEALLTCFDSYHIAVSQAASELGLPHEPTPAYQIATDKFRLSAAEGRKCFLATGIENVIKTAQSEDLPWPVIIKPCRGWGSELVFRANNAQELAAWASSINSATSHGTEFVVEPYCDGPEVDINFVMYNGEVLFWEIGDENPKSADDGSDSFHELDCVSPSALPDEEQHILRDSIVNTLQKLGFRNGIYHCEARVANSSHEWRMTQSGSPALVLRSEPRTESPSCFLMDCNVRPPGLNSSDIVETTWGVDYWTLLIAIPLREEQRVKALAQPFREGPQYFADMIFVSAEFDKSKEGIWQSGNVTEELKAKRPDLAKYISKALTYKKKGDRIPHPSTGTNTFVAYLNIFSRESRAHVLEMATEVRREIAGSIEIS